MVFIDVVQTWYGRESLHYVATTFLLRSYCVLTTSITLPPRFYHVHTTLYKTTLRFFHVRPVLTTSVVRLYQVLTESMACPEFLTFSLGVSTFIMNTQTKNVLLQCALYQGNQTLLEAYTAFVLLRRIRWRRNRRQPRSCYLLPWLLPYRQHQHKHWGQVWNCFPFSDLYAFSSDL